MILNALIVDDEPLAHELILEYLEDISHVEVVGQCYLACEALTFVSKHSVDIIFLDINMPKLNGIEFLKILDVKPQIIITSAYQQYALESFELDVCDYLLKPFRYDRFLKALNKATKQHSLLNGAQPAPQKPTENAPKDKAQKLWIKVDKQQIQLELSEITHLEAYGNYVKVWVGEKPLLTARTLSSFEQQLQDTQFQRIHKSFIVNKSQIHSVQGNQVQMSNGQTVALGKSYRHLAKALIL